MTTGEQHQKDTVQHAGASSFDLSSFKLEQGVLEIRYPLALSLWDRSGVLWRSIQGKWPELRLVHAEPMRTAFHVGLNALKVETELASITSVNPERSLDEFCATAKEFFTLTTQHLHISMYKRLGFRLLFFKDKQHASEAFFGLNLVKVPGGKKFEVNDQPIDPQYLLRWESEKKGAMISCRVETRKIEFEPPPALESLIKAVGELSLQVRGEGVQGYVGNQPWTFNERLTESMMHDIEQKNWSTVTTSGNA